MGNITTTASGNVASFMSPYEVSIRSMKVHFSPTQEGEGDPSPSNIRPINGWNGVNVYHDKKTVIWNNLIEGYFSSADWEDRNSNETTTTFEDGMATVQFLNTTGTYHTMMTKNSHYTYNGHKYYYHFQCMLNKIISGGVGSDAAGVATYPTMKVQTDEWGEYSAIVICRQDRNSNFYIPLLGNYLGIPEGVIAKVKNAIMIDLTKMYGAGNEPTGAVFEAECALNGIDLNSTFHVNYAGTEIPWKTLDTVEIPVSFPYVGKNIGNWLAPNGYTFTNDYNGYNVWSNAFECSDKIGTTYTYSVYLDNTEGSSAAFPHVWTHKSDGTYNRIDIVPESSATYIQPGQVGRCHCTFTVLDGDTSIHCGVTVSSGCIASKPMLEVGSTLSDYEPCTNTVYGGYVDLTKGEVVKEYEYIDLSTIEWDTTKRSDRAQSNIVANTIEVPINTNTIPNLVCEKYKPIMSGADLTNNQTSIAVMSGGIIIFYYDGENLPSGGMVYKLATPITYQLTPQQINTLKGYNSIWSNTNDIVEVEYDFTETAEIHQAKKRVLASQPHIDSMSGFSANFTTDLKANLKECKIHFIPVQSGSGDPSPENVRSFVERTSVTVTHCQGLWDGKYELGVLSNTGEEINEISSRYRNVGYIQVIPGSKMLYKYSGSSNIFVCEYDENYEFIKSYWQYFATYTILDSSTHYIRFFMDNAFSSSYVDGNLCVTYYPDSSNQIEISFGENGTIYGGYIDLAKGQIVKEWGSVLGSSLSWFKGSVHPYFATNRLNDSAIPSIAWPEVSIMCDSYKTHPNRNNTDGFYANVSDYTVWQHGNVAGDVKQIRVKDTRYETLEDFNAAIANVRFVYKLATPITYQITPQQIKTLYGINSILSSVTGNVEVKYWTH